MFLRAVWTVAAVYLITGVQASAQLPPSNEAAVASELPAASAGFQPLFNGQSLAGWRTIQVDGRWWRVEDGVIVGGSPDLSESIPHNTFLETNDEFGDFELRVKLRLAGKEGFVNSGIQFRSLREGNSHEMIGYQADVGDNWWGKLYDESRRNRVLAEPPTSSKIQASIDEGKTTTEDGGTQTDWVDYRIVAEGNHLRAWVNGIPAFDYTETEPGIAQKGKIALQAHGNGVTRVEIAEVMIKRL